MTAGRRKCVGGVVQIAVWLQRPRRECAVLFLSSGRVTGSREGCAMIERLLRKSD